MRTHGSNTELGSINRCPPELLMIVNLMLASRDIMTVFWGTNRLMMYNDHYIPQLGKRHPMLGRPLREVWPDVVDQVAPLIDPAFEERRSSYLDDSPLNLIEDGKEIQRLYTASFEPIWVRRGDAMRVEGVYPTAINNTAKIEAQQRLRASEA